MLKFIKYVTTTLLHSNIKSNAQFHNIFLVNAQKITIFISESQHHIPYWIEAGLWCVGLVC